MSGMQKAGSQIDLRLQFAAQTEATLGIRRQEGGLHRVEARPEGRIREAVKGARQTVHVQSTRVIRLAKVATLGQRVKAEDARTTNH